MQRPDPAAPLTLDLEGALRSFDLESTPWGKDPDNTGAGGEPAPTADENPDLGGSI